MSRRELKKLTGRKGKRHKLRKKLPKGVDSGLEGALKNKMAGCEWKPPTVPYVMKKKYNPDAKYEDTLIEIKGRFRTSDEAAKYIWVRENLPPWEDIVFVFANPKLKMPNARTRKDGTFRTHGEWAAKHGFTYYSPDNIPEEWNEC